MSELVQFTSGLILRYEAFWSSFTIPSKLAGVTLQPILLDQNQSVIEEGDLDGLHWVQGNISWVKKKHHSFPILCTSLIYLRVCFILSFGLVGRN